MVYFRDENHEVLNMVYVETDYGEQLIAPSRSANVMKQMLKVSWLFWHGAPEAFSANPKFCRPVLKALLESHEIVLADLLFRYSHKNGFVERHNGTFKEKWKKISRERMSASPTVLVARALMLCNLMHENAVLRSCELQTGYALSIVGKPPAAVLPDVFQAKIEHDATRALKKVLTARMPRTVPPAALYEGKKL